MWLAERVWEPHAAARAARGRRGVRAGGRPALRAGRPRSRRARRLLPDRGPGRHGRRSSRSTSGCAISSRSPKSTKSIEYLGELTAARRRGDGGRRRREVRRSGPAPTGTCTRTAGSTRFFDASPTRRGSRAPRSPTSWTREPAAGRVYLPTASYQEMGEWALPTDAGRALEEAQARPRASSTAARGWSACCAAASGGTSSSSIPRSAEIYWKMLRLSAARHAGRTSGARDDPRLLAGARGALARPGQRRVLARRVRRLLSPAPAPGGEERADRLRAPARGPAASRWGSTACGPTSTATAGPRSWCARRALG